MKKLKIIKKNKRRVPQRRHGSNRKGRKQVLPGLLFALMLVLVIVAFAPSLLNPFVRDALESWLRSQTAAEVSLGQASLSWRQISISDLVYRDRHRQVQIKVPRLRWRISGLPLLNWTRGSGLVRLDVRQPSVSLTISQLPPENTERALAIRKRFSIQRKLPFWLAPWGPGPSTDLARFLSEKTQVEVDRGELDLHFLDFAKSAKERIQTLRFTDLTLRHEPAKTIGRTSAFSSSGKLNINGWNLRMQVPIEVHSDLERNKGLWQSENMRLKIAGLEFQGRGVSDFALDHHQWGFVAQVPDLAQVRMLPTFLPHGTWRGKLSGKFNLLKQPKRRLQISGLIDAQKLAGHIDWNSSLGKAKGLVAGNFLANFYFEKHLLLRPSRLEFDLSQLEMSYQDLFTKPAQIPLLGRAQMHGGGESFKLSGLVLQFANLHASAKGSVDRVAKGTSSLEVRIAKTSLLGWEKYFPFLGGAPLAGTLELNGLFTGNWQELNKASISLRPFHLDQVQAHLNWRDPAKNIFISGPLFLNSHGEIDITGRQIVQASLSTYVDASQMTISWANSFKKLGTQELKLKFAIQQDGKTLRIPTASMKTHAGGINLSGSVTDLSRFQILAESQQFRISQLGEWFAYIQPLKWFDQVNFKLNLAGAYDWEKNNWSSFPQLNGTYRGHSRHLNLSPPLPLKSQQPTQPLPNFISSLLQNAKFTGQWSVEKLTLQDQVASQLVSQGTWQQSRYLGQLLRGDFWGGTVRGPLVEIQTQPFAVKANLMFEKIPAENLLSRFPGGPLWRGPSHGRVELLIPSNPSGLLPLIRAQGSFTSSPADVAIPLAQQLNIEAHALNLPALRRWLPTAGELRGDFSNHDGQLKLANLKYSADGQIYWQGQGPIQSEVQLFGQVFLPSSLFAQTPSLNWQCTGTKESLITKIDTGPLVANRRGSQGPATPAARGTASSGIPTPNVEPSVPPLPTLPNASPSPSKPKGNATPSVTNTTATAADQIKLQSTGP